jgi:hypothetical protein
VCRPASDPEPVTLPPEEAAAFITTVLFDGLLAAPV